MIFFVQFSPRHFLVDQLNFKFGNCQLSRHAVIALHILLVTQSYLPWGSPHAMSLPSTALNSCTSSCLPPDRAARSAAVSTVSVNANMGAPIFRGRGRDEKREKKQVHQPLGTGIFTLAYHLHLEVICFRHWLWLKSAQGLKTVLLRCCTIQGHS